MENLNKKQNWGFAEIWNASLLEKNDRELTARDKLWASELGKAPIDLWLKMRAIKPTNPPNARSLRKFEAGNVFEMNNGLNGALEDELYDHGLQGPEANIYGMEDESGLNGSDEEDLYSELYQ